MHFAVLFCGVFFAVLLYCGGLAKKHNFAARLQKFTGLGRFLLCDLQYSLNIAVKPSYFAVLLTGMQNFTVPEDLGMCYSHLVLSA